MPSTQGVPGFVQLAKMCREQSARRIGLIIADNQPSFPGLTTSATDRSFQYRA